jgi:hypothetical protein
MPARHCIRAAVAILAFALPLPARAGQTASPAAVESPFAIFVQGKLVGSEQVAVSRTADGWTISSAGRLNAPLDVLTRQLVIKYDAAWKPLELTLDSTVRGEVQTTHTAVSGVQLTTETTIAGRSTTTTRPATAEILIPTLHFAAYEALSARLRTAPPGTTIEALVPTTDTELFLVVGQSTSERTETGLRVIDAKRTHVTLKAAVAGVPTIEMDVWGDADGRLLRVSVPDQALEFIREDLASASARRVPVFRSNDEQVKIPSNGFALAGTLSKPMNPGTTRLPAVVLVGGSSTADRDELAYDIPIFGQLADALAEAGFVVLRYDKRGVGQSGGRMEAATLDDYADDARSVVSFLIARKDVDPKRIVIVGYSDGGSVAMVLSARDKRAAALVLVAAMGVTGAELNLDQVTHAQERSGRSATERQATIDLQRKIQQAVLTGKGWEQVAAYRAQADTPWFQSFLAHDPAKVMPGVRQPVLILQGERDTQVPPENADRLAALAAARKNRPTTQTVKLPGINHLLAAAVTGEVDEYATLKEKRISPEVSNALVQWLRSTLVAP